jgi:dihydrofolate synthase / folylpolyglutamate synthase
VFHVAGTNGKGSTVATLDAVLRHAGYRVGRYTSPHLVDFRERIVVNGEPMPPAEIVTWLDRQPPRSMELGATFFEVTTAMAFDWFARAEVDVAVIEVGLGGRLDATNMVRRRGRRHGDRPRPSGVSRAHARGDRRPRRVGSSSAGRRR